MFIIGLILGYILGTPTCPNFIKEEKPIYEVINKPSDSLGTSTCEYNFATRTGKCYNGVLKQIGTTTNYEAIEYNKKVRECLING